MQKIFEVYWNLADGRDSIPSVWSESLNSYFNLEKPAQLRLNGTLSEVFFGVRSRLRGWISLISIKCFLFIIFQSSPPEFCTRERTDDLTALLSVINKANKFVYIAVMDYLPAMVFTKHHV